MPHSFLSLTKYRIRSRVRISRANAPIVFFDRTHQWGRDTRALSGNAAVEQARAALELLRDSEDENAWLLIKN